MPLKIDQDVDPVRVDLRRETLGGPTTGVDKTVESGREPRAHRAAVVLSGRVADDAEALSVMALEQSGREHRCRVLVKVHRKVANPQDSSSRYAHRAADGRELGAPPFAALALLGTARWIAQQREWRKMRLSCSDTGSKPLPKRGEVVPVGELLAQKKKLGQNGAVAWLEPQCPLERLRGCTEQPLALFDACALKIKRESLVVVFASRKCGRQGLPRRIQSAEGFFDLRFEACWRDCVRGGSERAHRVFQRFGETTLRLATQRQIEAASWMVFRQQESLPNRALGLCRTPCRE